MIDLRQIMQEQMTSDENKIENVDHFTLIKFNVFEKNYAVDIKYVHEIIESVDITPYPEHVNNHIGIINVRGEIIPLVQIEKESIKPINEKFKIIILEFTIGKLYAIRTNKVQKFSFKSDLLVSGQTINLNKTPACYLDEMIFENFFKEDS